MPILKRVGGPERVVSSAHWRVAGRSTLWVALTGCAAANAGPAPGTRALAAPMDAAAPIDAAAPWPNVVRLAVPPERRECSNGGSDPRLEWRDVGGQLEPVPSDGSPAAIAPLPFEAPPELSTTTAAATARSVVASDDGWLVAMDRGEFGAGLYWVERGSLRTQRLDASLRHPVRWLGTTEFGVVGAAGLCHGDICALRTSLYKVSRSVQREWRLEPVAVFDGCPAAFGSSAGGAALLVAAACSGLHRVDGRGARAVASWPSHLYPIQVVSRPAEAGPADAAPPTAAPPTAAPATAASAEAYFVSFGRVAARFSRDSAEWFAPRHCVDVTRGSDGRCACVAASP